MYITNRTDVARIAESYGVDWIFIDLETLGKADRQGHLDSVKSNHSFSDIGKIKSNLQYAQVLVRINPVNENTKKEISRAIDEGADIIMLPFFSSVNEVKLFIECVNGRVKTCLLCETPDAVASVDRILQVPGIDYIHIGLNDLHLGYGMKFMFELLANGTVEMLAGKFLEKNIPFGFGGIARLGNGSLPAERVIAEHYRIGSEMAILSRSFCNYEKEADISHIDLIFKHGMKEIRDYEAGLKLRDRNWFKKNKLKTHELVHQISVNSQVTI